MSPIYIFDLDGTLALIEHRRHFVQKPERDWRGFFAACVNDEPNKPVIDVFKSLSKWGAECWIWSGRSDEVRKETIIWLKKHDLLPWTFPTPFHTPERLMMRPAGDHQPDDKLKYGWLADLEPPERKRVTAVFDDRDRLVKMWREAGVPCFQVAPGNF